MCHDGEMHFPVLFKGSQQVTFRKNRGACGFLLSTNREKKEELIYRKDRHRHRTNLNDSYTMWSPLIFVYKT